jgi:membrane protease YdiL (CAAX protease family)
VIGAADGMVADAERIRRLEDPGRDFPFYRGWPVALSGRQWLLVLAAVLVALLVLAFPPAALSGGLGQWLPALLLAGLPLAFLAWVAPGHWRVLFGPVGWHEIKWMVLFALLNILVSMSVGALLKPFVDFQSNAAVAGIADQGAAEQWLLFIRTAPQLLGEEVITILPFLALLTLFTRRLGSGRRTAILWAWLLSALFFGLIHLPTYDWNLIQCVVIIGTARLVLTLPWIMTKNLWVSTGAHILNDWALFSLQLLGAGLVAAS